MRVLLIGSGGREHALAWCMSRSDKVEKIFAAPGNAGMRALCELVPLKVDQIDELVNFAAKEKIDLTIVGPEYPLSLGIVDRFKQAGLRVFGPTQAAAQIEASKAFAKMIMREARVKTAAYAEFSDLDSAREYIATHGAPIVLKADGLAAGKGVYVCRTQDEAYEALLDLYQKYPAMKIVIEDFLVGKEASYIVAVNGEEFVPLAASNDYKRIFDGDQGPNTGGMGTISPTPNLSSEQEKAVIEDVIKPVLRTMKARGTPYSGFLYAGLMIAPDGSVNVLEFNARLGDPETQVILRRIKSDLFEVLYGLLEPSAAVPAQDVRWHDEAAICVVLASRGYPESSSNGDEINGIAEAESLDGVVIFHAGTALNDRGELVTAGGRVLNVTACGRSIKEARALAYQASEKIRFDGKQMRSDIGA